MGTAGDRCALCDLSTEGVNITDAAGNHFCCSGCRDVHGALDDIEGVDEADVREARSDDDAVSVPDDHEQAYFEVTGMHCVSCEAFIEATATELDGVSDARASYVTETVRVDHDPEAVDEDELLEQISRLGYSGYPREDSFKQRQASNWEFARLGVGVLFGMMVMLQYVTIIYPTYFGGLFYPETTAAFLDQMMTGPSAQYFFVVIGALTTIVLLVTGKPILSSALVAIRMRSPNMELLVAIAAVSAYLYSVVTTVTGGTHIYYDVTVVVLVAVTAGSYYESTIKREAAELLSDLTTVQVDTARRETADGYEEVSVSALSGGDHVQIRAGERVPVDGAVVSGSAAADEAVVTGESLPVQKEAGDRVVGGSVVTDGSLVVTVDEGATSSLDRIANLAWDLQSGSRGIQGVADRLATIFVPLVLVLAAGVTVISIAIGTPLVETLQRALAVLIVACPCAMGLATPLAIASGVQTALEEDIVVFDETVFERVRGADTVVFDKTGTLTTGELTVLEDDAPGALLERAAELEAHSAHPVARAIVDAYGPQTDGGTVTEATGAAGATDTGRVEQFEDHTRGVSGVVDGVDVAVGHPALFDRLGWSLPDELADRASEHREAGRLPIVLGSDGTAEGLVVFGDELRAGWEDVVRSLDDQGIDVVVLTGDDEQAARQFAEHECIDQVFAGVPPEGKAETVARLAARGEVVMVGDGTNDAPALARADLGIALGGGTAMAVDAADVAIVDDSLDSVERLFELSRAAGSRITQNIGWALCYNAIAIPLAVSGLLNPLFAAVAMATSSLLVVANSSRTLR